MMSRLLNSVCLLLLVVPGAAAAGNPPGQESLSPGGGVERELKGGESHSYRVRVKAGQYFMAVVEQKSADVAVSVFDPQGRKSAEVDKEPAGNSEAVFLVADLSGEYRLEVGPSSKDAEAGRYALRVEELRGATARDRTRVAAERTFEAGGRLRALQTAESRRDAVGKYEEALALSTGVGDKKGEAHALNELGVTYSGLGEPRKAVEYYSRALPLWRELGERINEAITLTNKGTAHWRVSEPQKALECHGEALRLASAAGALKIEGVALGNTGAVYWTLGQPQEAMQYYARALAIARKLGDRRRQAITLNNIATAYQQLGELQRASQYLKEALQLRIDMGDRQGVGAPLTNLGWLYTRLGDFQRASEVYTQALELRRESGDRQGEAADHQGLSIVQMRLGDLGSALNSAEQALTLSRAVGDRQLEAYTLVVIGKISQLRGEAGKALEQFEQALTLRRSVGDRYGEVYALCSAGDALLELGDPAKATDNFRLALQISRDVGDGLGEAMALYWLARAASVAGENVTARRHIETALALIEATRTKVVSRDLRSSFSASHQDYYEFTVDLLMRMHRGDPSAGHHGAALQASERTRARWLLETLAEAQVDIREGVESALLERGRSLQARLNAAAEKLTRLQYGKHTDEQLAAARAEVKALLAEFDEVEGQIRVKSPRYAALTRPRPLSPGEIQQLLDEETVLLEYALGRERSYLWAVTLSTVESFVLPKRSEVEAQARRVYEALTARNRLVPFEKPGERRARIAMADAAYAAYAAALSQTILGPLAGRLGRKRLLIVSDGALQYVPFGALPIPTPAAAGKRRGGRDGGYRPLISEHEIVSLPSASTLAGIRNQATTPRRGPATVLVLADPVFEPDDPRVNLKRSAPRRQTNGGADGRPVTAAPDASPGVARDLGADAFVRLRHTRREANAITALSPAPASRRLLDFEASHKAVAGPELGGYRIVHFATHGLLNDEHPALSGIVLSLVDEEGKPQNGFLRLNEIYNLKLGADLVVISSCQTALGKEIKGEGLVGLTSGFMYTGARAVVASLWEIDDETTVELMTHFYRGMLVRGRRPAAALREAQLSVWQRRQLPPYFWAAFVLQGDWR